MGPDPNGPLSCYRAIRLLDTQVKRFFFKILSLKIVSFRPSGWIRFLDRWTSLLFKEPIFQFQITSAKREIRRSPVEHVPPNLNTLYIYTHNYTYIYIIYRVVVEATHLKNMLVKLDISPRIGVKRKNETIT